VVAGRRRKAAWESASVSLAVLVVVAAGTLGLWVNRALLGLAPAGILIALLGAAFYRIRLRGLTDAYTALESAKAAKTAAEGLAEERRRLSAVIEGTNVGTWEWDSGSRVISINERWAAMIGYRMAELSELTYFTWQRLVHPEDVLAVRRTIAACLTTVDKVFVGEFRMKHAAGHWVWVLARGKVMHSDERQHPLHVAGIVLDVSARKSMESALIDAAQKDKLTGLPNRAVFMAHLQEALTRRRSGEPAPFAVLFLDFDRFKLVNDTLGHEAGDELLRQIGQRLKSELRIEDFWSVGVNDNLVSRFGGDEFLILVTQLHATSDAVLIAERLLNSLAPAYNVFGSDVHSMASVGIVTSEQSEASAEEIVRNADVAMYEAKRLGRGCSVVFNEAMHARLTRHVAIETCLRRAIGTAELFLEYQTIVDLRTGRSVSVEALARWNHPTMGTISPSEFIPIAEESGLIVAVGQWVLEEACRTMATWRAADAARAPGAVSVNISRAEIALGDRFLAQVDKALLAANLPAQCLQLEVTEREVMQNPDAARELLQKLKHLGIKLSMDDFGTGTSSLSLLRGYSFDTVKIDRSFLQDLTTSPEVLAVIHATINLIENLNMESVAEGVEDATQVAVLQSLGCRYAQGYFFSRPVPAGRLLEAIAPATNNHSRRMIG
jgi:diguanylate cyclase (GGDEF)-like protein/PAS domain S-box-containing protein